MSIILKDLISFLKKPIDRLLSKDIVNNKFSWFFGILLINFVFTFIYVLIASLLESMGLIDSVDHKIVNLMDEPVWLFAQAVLIAPIVEELIFRFQLTFRRNYILKGFIFAAHKINRQDYQSTENRFKSLWDRYFAYVFYTVALIFAFIHSVNFLNINYFLLPILVLPQFIIGLLIGYLRIRLGFIWGYLLHFLNNLIAISIIFISVQGIDNERIEIESNNFEITIESRFSFSFPEDIEIQFYQDSIIVKDYSIDLLYESLKDIDKSRIELKDPQLKNTYYSINCYKKQNGELNQDIIMDSILKALDVVVDEELRTIDGYELVISDSKLLKKHQTLDTISKLTSSTRNEFKFGSRTLSEIAMAIGKYEKEKILADTSMKDVYSFTIPNKSIQEIDEYLNKNIGLDLKPVERKMKFYRIESK